MVTVSNYERPNTMSEAIAALSREHVVVIGGGTKVNPAARAEPVTVVDLQALPLYGVQRLEGGALRIGATTTLQNLADHLDVPPVIREAARCEEPSTLRAFATLGGCVATADPESELLATLLAYDATVSVAAPSGTQTTPLADTLRNRGNLAGRIITAVTIETDGIASVARVGRTPADRPIVAAVARTTPSGEVRLALTGVAATPILVKDAEGLDPPADFRGSSEYRRAIATTLIARAVEAVR